METRTKIGIGIAIAVAVGVGVYFVVRKSNPSFLKKDRKIRIFRTDK
jgi:hypothetical protein